MPVESSGPAHGVGVEAVSSRRRQSLMMTSSRSKVRRHPWIFDPAHVTAGIDDPIERLKALVHAKRHVATRGLRRTTTQPETTSARRSVVTPRQDSYRSVRHGEIRFRIRHLCCGDGAACRHSERILEQPRTHRFDRFLYVL